MLRGTGRTLVIFITVPGALEVINVVNGVGVVDVVDVFGVVDVNEEIEDITVMQNRSVYSRRRPWHVMH